MIDTCRAGDAHEARMLAGAIVVQRGRRAAGVRQRMVRSLVRRPVRAAFERRRVEAGARQHAARDLDMRRLAAVARTRERKLRVAEPVAIRGAALDQRQRLQRLHGGARIDRLPGVAERQYGRAVGVDHHDGPAVAALHQGAAGDLDQFRITHLSCFPAGYGARLPQFRRKPFIPDYHERRRARLSTPKPSIAQGPLLVLPGGLPRPGARRRRRPRLSRWPDPLEPMGPHGGEPHARCGLPSGGPRPGDGRPHPRLEGCRRGPQLDRHQAPRTTKTGAATTSRAGAARCG